jgi:hypothetical protein
MRHQITSPDDLRWLIGHTGGFRSGYITDLQMSKRRLFDEETRHDVLADTIVSVAIQYEIRGLSRVAKLTMIGVTDFSVFEQEGADCSSLSIIHAECNAGKLRFWFDPQGELYVVCEEAQLEEVSTPCMSTQLMAELARWTFQGQSAEGPTLQWFLDKLDRAGLPCSWRETPKHTMVHQAIQWEGDLIPSENLVENGGNAVHVIAYGPLDGQGFGLMLRVFGTQDRLINRILEVLADQITQQFAGDCLIGTTIIPGSEWEGWLIRERRSGLN